jgi:hypothetical protein
MYSIRSVGAIESRTTSASQLIILSYSFEDMVFRSLHMTIAYDMFISFVSPYFVKLSHQVYEN